MTTRISCQAHDYFEIVCMRRSKVNITMFDDRKLAGVALTIKQMDGNEQLIIESGVDTMSIALTEIAVLEAVDNVISQHNFKYELALLQTG